MNRISFSFVQGKLCNNVVIILARTRIQFLEHINRIYYLNFQMFISKYHNRNNKIGPFFFYKLDT